MRDRGDGPPRFLARRPHGYHDRAAILRDVASAAVAARFGTGAIDAKMQAHVVSAAA